MKGIQIAAAHVVEELRRERGVVVNQGQPMVAQDAPDQPRKLKVVIRENAVSFLTPIEKLL